MPEKVRELQADWDKWSAEQAKPLWAPANQKNTTKKLASDDDN